MTEKQKTYREIKNSSFLLFCLKINCFKFIRNGKF